jgi:molybdate transport repressor ModE-like protein
MAVKELGMSYSHAWNTLYKINCQLEAPLMITRRGGKGGGVAYLTPAGEELLDRFTELKREIQNVIKANKIIVNQYSSSA